MIQSLKSLLKLVPGVRGIALMLQSLFLKTKAWFKWKELAKNSDIKIELGSGAKKGSNGFTTVDLLGADIYRDLREGIPLSANSVSVIYCSHMLEHIPYLSLPKFLEECKRVLKPNGQLSVCVPNAKYYIEAYIERRHFRDAKNFYGPAAVNTGSYLDQVNYIAYMGGEHCYMFDEENLVNTLRSAGFSQVMLRTFDESIDLLDRDYESIYALAIK
jgi:ubiquinone/menaquinone biosynthesis C-methylase UbiE